MGLNGDAFMNRVTDVPIQMIWGENDPALGLVLLDGTERFASRLKIQRLPGVGHWVNHEAWAEVNKLLLEWQLPSEAPVTP
jgi:pimeloyl-ACP methyl ester carboxylesterase